MHYRSTYNHHDTGYQLEFVYFWPVWQTNPHNLHLAYAHVTMRYLIIKIQIWPVAVAFQIQLLVHIDAEMAFTNTRHEDFIGKAGEQPSTHDSPEFTQSLTSVRMKIDQTAKVLV